MDQKETLYYRYHSNFDQNIIDKQLLRSQNILPPEILTKMKEAVISLMNEQPKIPLIQNEFSSISLSRQQVFAFLSLMFFDLTVFQSQKEIFPNIIDMSALKSQSCVSQQKLKCVLNYFIEYCSLTPQQQQEEVKFTKMVFTPNYHIQMFFKNTDSQILDENLWKSSDAPLSKFEFKDGRIEDCKNSILVDFADPYVCGLTLDPVNCAQEEVIMALHPEAIVAALFISIIKVDQAVYIENVLRINKYSGYERTFKCLGKMENLERINILAIDAGIYYNSKLQFQSEAIIRDLNKAFYGFTLYDTSIHKNLDVSTGKWGCGIFGGDIPLKTIIQLMAFSQSTAYIENNPPKIIFNTFQDWQYMQMKEDLDQIIIKFKTVGALMQELTKNNSRDIVNFLLQK